MNRQEAEAYFYLSYLEAEKQQDYQARDAYKRNPAFTREAIRQRAGTPCIAVTGSKGKGSAACMISQVLQPVYRTGLMTSPHLSSFCERFRVNGEMISDADLIRYVSRIRPETDRLIREVPPGMYVSPVGIQTILALEYFHDMRTDFNVMECGKGARYDDVNNTLHEYAVINTIFPEHTRELGDTVEEIAGDKACVITGDQKCAYTAGQQDSVLEVIRKRAAEYNTPLKVYGADFGAEHIRYTEKGMLFDVFAGDRLFRDLSVPLMGEHQARNCALAMAVCADILPEADPETVRRQLSRINWPGRQEVLSEKPFILLDACIHPASCREVLATIRHLKISGLTAVIGIPDDKDYAGVIREMHRAADEIILTRSGNPHYRFTKDQQVRMRKEGIDTRWTDSVEEAVETACRTGRPVAILGTTSVVAEVKQLQKKNSFPPGTGTENN